MQSSETAAAGDAAAQPQRILFITKNEFQSERDGGSQRTAALVRALCDRGYQVDTVTVSPAVGARHDGQPVKAPSAPFAVARVFLLVIATLSVSSLKWFSPRAVRLIVGLTRTSSYDAIVLEYSQLDPLRVLLPRPVVLSMHNVESELMANYAVSASSVLRRAAARHESRRLQRIESRCARRYDLVVTVSPRDLAVLDLSDSNAISAANGVRDECFLAEGPRAATVVFIAHLGWRPNIDAAIWLTRSAWPIVLKSRPDLSLQLVGKAPSDEVLRLRSESVSVHGDVPSTVPFVKSALVATAPLLAAGGTRLKILEALATGTPVAATSLGALGLESLEGTHLRVGDDPEAFAHQVVDLAGSPADREEVRSLAEAYRWDRALSPFISAVERLIETGTPQ